MSLRKVCQSVLGDKGKQISVSYLNDIEQGYRNPPKNKIIVQLAEVLELEPQELLNIAGKVHPVIEDVGKEAKASVLFRELAEHIKRDPRIIESVKEHLNQKRISKNDALG